MERRGDTVRPASRRLPAPGSSARDYHPRAPSRETGHGAYLAGSSSQLGVLVSRQLQPYRTSAHTDPVFDCLTASEIELGAAMPGQVEDLQFALEDEIARQRCLAVLLKE